MQRFALGLFAALSLAAFDVSAVSVSKAAPVKPGKGGSCPVSMHLITCRTFAECQGLVKVGQSLCVGNASSRSRAVKPAPRMCPVSPGSKVMKKC
jgi:hypothetical protein